MQMKDLTLFYSYSNVFSSTVHAYELPLPLFFSSRLTGTLKESVDIWEVAALENLFILLVSMLLLLLLLNRFSHVGLCATP